MPARRHDKQALPRCLFCRQNLLVSIENVPVPFLFPRNRTGVKRASFNAAAPGVKVGILLNGNDLNRLGRSDRCPVYDGAGPAAYMDDGQPLGMSCWNQAVMGISPP